MEPGIPSTPCKINSRPSVSGSRLALALQRLRNPRLRWTAPGDGLNFYGQTPCAAADTQRDEEVPPWEGKETRGHLVSAESFSTFAHCDPDFRNEETPRQIGDLHLIGRVARGEVDAFATLYDRFCGPLYSMCLRMTGDLAEAEDILQDACLTIWRGAATYDATRGSVFGWAMHLTRCKTIDHLRARGRRLRVVVSEDPVTSEDFPDSRRTPVENVTAKDPGPADLLDQREQAGRVRLVLGKLSTVQREAIEMAFFADMTHHEIAARLRQPLGTIKSDIRRGLLKLRDRIKAR